MNHRRIPSEVARSSLLALLAIVALAVGSPAHAQVKTRSVLTLEAAKRIAAAAEAEAVRNGWSVVIAIVDAGGNLHYLERMDDVQVGSLRVATEKARSAALFRRPTAAFQARLEDGRTGVLGLPGALPLGGGEPITLSDGEVIGGIGVSGVTSEQDTQIARAGVAALNAGSGQGGI